ncbi:hypothetical protein K449DRAFT_387304 [Hypoxylon sp. EC38]|nr:hypothetical protein K449DRAFT_387304 [Hypoxylon sp. EC38]
MRGVADTLKSQLPRIIRDVQNELDTESQSRTGVEDERGLNELGENVAQASIPEPEPVPHENWTIPSCAEPWSQLRMEDQQVTSSSSPPESSKQLGVIPSLSADLDPLDFLGLDNNNYFDTVSPVPFWAKANYDYISNDSDDLTFKAGQIIMVTNEVNANWYSGEYIDDFGIKKEGIFPSNFVEKYVPTVPPRPVRSRREDLERTGITLPFIPPPRLRRGI